MVETVVAASALIAGAALLLARGVPRGLGTAGLAAGFALAGLFHGHAFAEAVVGAQPGPVGAYLTGLALVQGALAFAALALARRWRGRDTASGLLPALLPARAVGAAAVLAGVASLAA